MKKMILFAILMSACADEPEPTRAAPKTGAAWVCYTHASCSVADDGRIHNAEQRLCLSPDKTDVLEPGDAAARGWASIWKGACESLEGNIGTAYEGTVCAVPDFLNPSIYDPMPFGCSVNCEPLFEGC